MLMIVSSYTFVGADPTTRDGHPMPRMVVQENLKFS